MLTWLFILAVLQPQSAPPSPTRDAVHRALPALQRSATEFVSKRSCFSCHHNALPILALHMAKERGFSIDPGALSLIEDKTFAPLRGADALDETIQVTSLSDPTPNDSLLLIAAASAGIPRDLTTAVRAQQLLSWQQTDGHWATSDFRPPHSSSLFTATATAVRALHFYSPPELRTRQERALSQARVWMKKTSPASTEDAAFRLMGLVWASASNRDIATAKADLLALQGKDGGWPQLNSYASDAYST